MALIVVELSESRRSLCSILHKISFSEPAKQLPKKIEALPFKVDGFSLELAQIELAFVWPRSLRNWMEIAVDIFSLVHCEIKSRTCLLGKRCDSAMVGPRIWLLKCPENPSIFTKNTENTNKLMQGPLY